MKQLFIVNVAVPYRDAKTEALVRVGEDRRDRIAPGQSGEDRHPGRVLGTIIPAVQIGDNLVVAMSTRGAGA